MFLNLLPYTLFMPYEGERLQKYMARCGVGSRRKCEELILKGRVLVNGSRPELGSRVCEGDVVELDGETLSPKKNAYYMVNKPEGYVCSNTREKGRKRVIELVPQGESQGMFTVGRLDVGTSGLIIVTNDGDIANNLIHPSRGLEKEYVAVIKGGFGPRDKEKMEKGVDIGDGKLAKARIKKVAEGKEGTRIWIIIEEGRYRMIRRMLKVLNKRVVSLHRIRIGKLRLGNLPQGGYLTLEADDLASLSETCSQ